MSIEEKIFYTRRHTPWLLQIQQLNKTIENSSIASSNSSKEKNNTSSQNNKKLSLCQWSTISLKELENLELEGRCIKMFYKSFFVVLRSPEIVVRSFWSLLTETPQ